MFVCFYGFTVSKVFPSKVFHLSSYYILFCAKQLTINYTL